MAFLGELNVHNVTRIRVAACKTFRKPDGSFCHIRLKFDDEVEFSIYGEVEIADKVERLAAAIKEIFGEPDAAVSPPA